MKNISLLLPMNGAGDRFARYSGDPKPLIKIFDREMVFWLLDSLDLSRVNRVIIPYNSVLDDYNFEEKVRVRYPEVSFKLMSLTGRTSGAVETINIALEQLSAEELNSNFMIIDCDTFYYEDVIESYSNSIIKNAIFYSVEESTEEIFSYIKIENNRISEIKEKEKISDFVNCGIFCVEDGNLLKKYCSVLLSHGVRQKNEFYTSGIFHLMIQDQVPIVPIKVREFECVGTPQQLEEFVNIKRRKI